MTGFKPVKTKRTSESILEQIKQLIIEGQLSPGDKLLTERELSVRLQVSRASVREALSALNLAGILEIRHGEGIYVKRPGPNAVIEPLAFLLLLEKDKLQNILEVRKALEVEAAGLAAERCPADLLQEMKKVVEEMEEDLLSGGARAEELDLRLHLTVAQASRNPLLSRLMNTVQETMNQTLRVTRALWLSATAGTTRRLFEEHREIYLAIADRDKERARDIMYRHLWKVEVELARVNLTEHDGQQ
ncbi:FCD domain-containing protein [Desulfofundulus thermobenzoicus]|uniref:FCD domain-containing protein n=1 Tax=Desulfofundulus thermobenzoicus TaxID=29376 RepID=A0A6N7IRX6_9FIRM|nr:FadR/GntR family transcriptional regulator [Desulfofundulus thermobenzoicus]MQL52885.1 FCD domain-containing protein [Desulfofundulus thermobenzoicus]HHW44948.1 FadR family transcriptional regulator [Desulfotomaculum sp.]